MYQVASIVAFVLCASPCFAADEASVVPGAEWQHTTDGFDAAKLDALRAWLRTQQTTGLVVVSDGRVAFEYGDVAHVSKVASVRKSILAMLYGRYVESGAVDLDRTVKDLELDDLTPFLPVEENATLRHLLLARSGVYLPNGNPEQEAQVPQRGSHAPGTYYQYQNWDFNAAGAAFEKLTGRDIYEALETDLARPLGFQDFRRGRQEKHDSAGSRS